MTRPPRLAWWVLERSLAPEEREAVLGDVLEEFDARARDDVPGARRWFRQQVRRSVAPNIGRRWRRADVPRVPLQKGPHAMHGLAADLLFTLRQLRRTPLAHAAGVLSLGVALGVNILLMTLANAVLLRPLPVREPSQLRLLALQRPANLAWNFSYPDYAAIRDASRQTEGVIAYSSVEASSSGAEGATRVDGQVVSGNFFPVLGVRMIRGRALGPGDDQAGTPPAVVVSARLWRDRFGDAPLEHQQLVLNGQAFSITGVAEPVFTGTQIGRRADFWLPIAHGRSFVGGDLTARPNASWLNLMARVRVGIQDAPARQELDGILRGAFEARGRAPEPLVVLPGARGESMLPARLQARFLALLGAGALVLVVGLLNAANLQLARGDARRAELAVRSALGAGRARLIRLVLIDSLLLSALAAALGVGIAAAARGRAVSLIALFGEPVSLQVPIDARVTIASAALALVSALAMALLSSWHTVAANPGAALQEGRAVAGSRRRTQRALVVVQFALSMALLVGSALLLRTLHNLRSIDLGVDVDRLAVAQLAPDMANLDPRRSLQYFDELLRRVRTLPGVERAAVSHVMPLDFGGSRMSIEIAGYTPAQDEDMELNYARVTPDYFATVGIPLRAGRAFDERDTREAPRRIIVNETMARRYWPDGRAVGGLVRFDSRVPYAVEVVGVAADAHYRMVREEPQPSFYVPLAQMPAPFGVLHVRTADDPVRHLPAVRAAAAAVNPAVPVVRLHTLRAQIDRNLADERLASAIGLSLAGATVVLAAVGLYSTMAFVVGRRRREMGVRIALGARRADLQRLVIGDAVALVVPGVIAGFVLAVWAARGLGSMLYGASAFDAGTVAAAAALLGVVSLAASWVPARRASSVDPVAVLRGD